MSLSGKVVLITGASSGIGEGIAVHLAKEDVQLALVGRNADKFPPVLKRVKETGTKNEPLVILADVGVDAERIISETVAKFGRIDVLINNAGTAKKDYVNSFSPKEFDVMMATNLRGAVHLSHLAEPHLIASKGNILNISGACTFRTLMGALTYCMSKSAMDEFTKSAALELAPKGVRVNALNPAAIDTDFRDNLDLSPEHLQEILAKHPIGRIGTCEDVAKATAFIINNELAPFLTGARIPLDGGYSLG